MSAQSATERHIGPSLSIVQLSVIAPVRLTVPKVGRNPVTPLRVEGDTIDPHVSEPIEKATIPAAVAEPGPAELPLEPCSRSQGLRVLPSNHTSPQARAPRLSLAINTAPASSSF